MKDNLGRIKEELLLGHDINTLAYNRPGSRRGGGVALFFKHDLLRLEENKFKREGFEIISAFGRLNKETRKVVFYGVYLPPNLKADRARRYAAIVTRAIGRLKGIDISYDCSIRIYL